VIAGFVQRIKGRTDVYTTAIGEDLGIIGDEDDFDADNFVPEFKGKIMPEGPKLEFGKDQTDGIHIYTRLKGVAEWNFLATDTESPYIDTRALANPNVPEVREYRCRAFISDTEIGQWSGIVSVTVGG
jgi:hypothetical protein